MSYVYLHCQQPVCSARLYVIRTLPTIAAGSRERRFFYHPSKCALLNGQALQVASHCVWHPIFVWATAFHYGGGDTALLTIERTTGKLLYIGTRPRRLPIYLVGLARSIGVEPISLGS